MSKRAKAQAKLTRREIVSRLAETLGIPAPQARRIWLSTIQVIRDTLLEGRAVGLANVGALAPYVKQATTYRHPETGGILRVPERKHLRFIMSCGLKKALRGVE